MFYSIVLWWACWNEIISDAEKREIENKAQIAIYLEDIEQEEAEEQKQLLF